MMAERISLTIDGQEVTVPLGTRILGAIDELGIETPTLCYDPDLTPVNACRVCVVELKGARVLAPACSRQAEGGMEIFTDTPRVQAARRMVLEMLQSSVDTSTSPSILAYAARYGTQPHRFDGDSHNGFRLATVEQPVRLNDNLLYVRDYSKCILCYKCVEACGDDVQHTFAISVAGRGFDAHIDTGFDVALGDSPCVYCGNCVAVCPTGALVGRAEYDMRQEGSWNEEAQTQVDTICPYCGVGCELRLHVQNNRIVKVSSSRDHPITHGFLCVKGRFGYEFMHGGSKRHSVARSLSGRDGGGAPSDGSAIP
jgi:predicted molibdopterin-dependent oxidoreductase YjgC